MAQPPLRPADVQPVGQKEFHTEPFPAGEAEDLAKVREWARQVGGVERLKRLCEALERDTPK